MKKEEFCNFILVWHDRYGRKTLPWQISPTPYFVWVSEVMLQQTQVATVIPYFEHFVRRFPKVETLAAAQEDEVFGLWSGLGYYRRAAHLRKTAQELVLNHNGSLPQGWQALLKLPGIGKNTAAAILSLAFGRPYPVFDGNVKRVLKRFWFGKPESQPNEAKLWHFAKSLVPQNDPGSYNQGMMDLGALVCVPNKPLCHLCPLQLSCGSHQVYGPLVPPIPKPLPRKSKPLRSVVMLWVENGLGEIWMEKVPKPLGIWSGLWAPRIYLSESDWLLSKADLEPSAFHPFSEKPLRQVCTHLILEVISHHVKVDQERWPPKAKETEGEGRWFSLKGSQAVGLPALIKKQFVQLKEGTYL